MKKFGILVVVIIGLAAAGFFWISANLDGIVKGEVERAGTDVTKTQVSLGSVSVKLASGKTTMHDLKIANPQGFEAENAVSLGMISIVVDISTLRSDVIVVEEVLIDQSMIAYERVKGGNNIDTIRDNASRGSSSSQKKDYSGPKFIIEKLSFTEGQVSVSGVRDEVMELKLPPINLRNIGTAEGGATPTQIGVQVTRALSDAVVEAVAKEGLNNVVGNKLDDVKDKVKGLFGK